MSLVAVAERGLRVRRRGQPPAPALLWVHGLGESGRCFEEITAHTALSPWRHLIPDLPGYGAGTTREPPLALASVADRLAEWLAELGEGPLVVLGHSLGGVLALLLAERHPERIRALVDVEGNKSAGDCVYSRRAAAQDAAAFRGGLEEMRWEVAAAGRDDPALRSYAESLALADAAALHAHAVELVGLSYGEGLADRLARLPLPSVFVGGAPGGVCARTLELLDRAGVTRFEIRPAGHWPFFDRPDDFASLLRGQLERLTGERP